MEQIKSGQITDDVVGRYAKVVDNTNGAHIFALGSIVQVESVYPCLALCCKLVQGGSIRTQYRQCTQALHPSEVRFLDDDEVNELVHEV